MPEFFAEMRADLKSFPMKREFILMPKLSMYNAGRKEPLSYHYEDHEDLADKVGLLVNEGVVTDITYNNVDRYVMSETPSRVLGRECSGGPEVTEVMAIGAVIAAVKDFVDLVGKLGDGVAKEQPEVISQLYDSVLDIQQHCSWHRVANPTCSHGAALLRKRSHARGTGRRRPLATSCEG